MITVFNDTQKPLKVRIHIKESVPSTTTVEPHKRIEVFTKTEDEKVNYEDRIDLAFGGLLLLVGIIFMLGTILPTLGG